GISLGYVWIADGKLVGNVSVYPARWPDNQQHVWIIANVGVHPDYQRRGIATQLMRAALDMVRHKGGHMAVLQVDSENVNAQSIYTRLGFVAERTWTTWRRSTTVRTPPPLEHRMLHISRRRREEWQAEMALAAQLRPTAQGGLGWQRPLHKHFFLKS